MASGKIVLISGINGFIASKLGLTLLEKGYTVRGTARRASSTKFLVDGPYAPYKDRFQVYEVPDITVSGAFDEAVKGVHGIMHTASPVDFSIQDPELYLKPALGGLVSMVESANTKAGPQLQALVVTSSVVAIGGDPTPDHVYTPADWWDEALEIVQRDGKKSSIAYWYAGSKVLAEKALWKFREEKHPKFSITTIHPACVTGPPAVLVSDPSKLNDTLQPTWKAMSGQVKTVDEIPVLGFTTYVDLRDVVRAHIWAFENPEKANGKRYILNAGQGLPQAQADILRKHFPELRDRVPEGNPGQGYNHDYSYLYGGMDGSQTERDMGFKFIDFEQTIKDTAEALMPLLAKA